MNIVLLGSGNVATQLGIALKQAGLTVSQVWSRNPRHAESLAAQLKATAVAEISRLQTNADMYLLAVSDQAITQVAAQLTLSPQSLLVHTSGTTGLAVLRPFSSRIGVLYPLQTISKTKSIAFHNVPLFIEANSAETLNTLSTLARRISSQVQPLDSEKRRLLHISAVFACNFTNHLYAIAQKLLADNQLSFDLIRPLIAETAAKVQQQQPAQVQTGPAIRQDEQTLQAHLHYLQQRDASLANLYELLSNHILQFEQ